MILVRCHFNHQESKLLMSTENVEMSGDFSASSFQIMDILVFEKTSKLSNLDYFVMQNKENKYGSLLKR